MPSLKQIVSFNVDKGKVMRRWRLGTVRMNARLVGGTGHYPPSMVLPSLGTWDRALLRMKDESRMWYR